MSAIKFSTNKQEQKFYNTLKERVYSYLKANNYSGYGTPLHYFKALLFFSIYSLSYLLLLFGDLSDMTLIGLYASFGITGLLVAFNVSHDACHECFLPNKRWNDIVYSLTFNMLGTNAYLWKMRHNDSHHLFPNVDGCDADIDNNAVIRLSPRAPLRWYQKYQHLYAPLVYLIYTLHWVFYKDFHYLRRKKLANMTNIQHSFKAKLGVLSAKALYFFYILILPIFIHPDQTGAIIVGFFCMHFTMSYFFLFTNILNHYAEGIDFPVPRASDRRLPHIWAVHQMAASQDFYPTNQVYNFFFGGFNAHNAHHIFPHIAHVHYSAISRIIASTAKEFDIPYKKTTWWKGMKSHFAFLKAMGRKRA